MPPGVPHRIVAIIAASWLAGCGTSHLAVLTQHNDSLRTGAYLHEKVLTPGAVDPVTGTGMVRRYSRPVNGNLNGQLLYAPRVHIGGERKDLVIAVTTNNQVSAWDLNEERDPGTARGLVWARNLPPTPSPTLGTVIGINSTPVIDRHRTLYLVYGISNGLFPSNGVGEGSYQVELRLAALDLRTGAVLRDTLISGSVPSTVAPGHVDFVARRQIQRAGLLLTGNPFEPGEQTIYIAFASRWREETHNWHGWVMGYDTASFAPRGVFCSTPDRRADSEGGGIWQGGGGIAADSDGNLYFNTGNGPGSGNDHGNSIVKLVPQRSSGGVYSFGVSAFSAAADDPAHATQWRDNDIDLGGGGVAVIPGTTQLASGGKTGVIYMMDRPTMAKLQSFDAFTNTYNPALRYDDWMSGPHLHGAPTYWQVSHDRGYLYHWGEKDRLKRFTHDRSTGLLGTASPMLGDVVATPDLMPGGLISLSAHGTNDGLLWITLPDYSDGRVFAYDALTMRRLWETTQSEGVSHNGPPTIAEGRVIVGGTNNAFVVYGLRRFPLLPPIEVERRPPFPIPPDPGPWIREALLAIPPGRAREIMPPAGHRAVFLASGSGTLQYEARRANESAPLQWVLVGISGPFVDQSGVMPQMGHGGLGHTLATGDQGFTLSAHGGSRATLEPAATVAAPKPADAAWMLFRAMPGERIGVLDSVSHVQRIETKGGVPAAAPRNAGQRIEVPYDATYVFYLPESKLP